MNTLDEWAAAVCGELGLPWRSNGYRWSAACARKWAAARRAAGLLARLGALAGQLFRQPQQRVRGALDDVLREFGDPRPA